ncbi:hypothetical protein Dimus_035218 [Dionaea muscipula]
MEEEGNSWIRRTKFSHTIYYRWDSLPSHRVESPSIALPGAGIRWSGGEQESALTTKHRQSSVHFCKTLPHTPNRVVQWNPLKNKPRSASPIPKSIVSDTFKEARSELKRFSTPGPRRTESDKGIMKKLFHKDSEDRSPCGPPLRSDKKHRKELRWSKIFDHGGGKITAVESVDEHMADMSQLLLGHRFAYGAHSRLHRGIYNDEVVAVKINTVPDDDDNGCLATLLHKQFSREVNFLSRLQHPNILKFVAAWKKPPVYCIITEYLSEGSLRAYLHKVDHKMLPLQQIVEFSLEIARGMEFVHSRGIIHRDLKPENVLIDQHFHMKIADFGTACEEAHVDHFSDDPGTYRWMAPEMIKRKPYGRKVDVYSFGLILWAMVAGSTPYEDMNPVQAAFAVVSKNMRPEFPKCCPLAMQALIEQCWSSHPKKRPEFSQIVQVLDHFQSSVSNNGTLPPLLDPIWLEEHKKSRSHRQTQKHGQLSDYSSFSKPRFT